MAGAKEFLATLPLTDMLIFVTARKEEYRAATEAFLKENGIRYDHIIFGAPMGERILINDKKPSGLPMSHAVNTERDVFMQDAFVVDETL